MPSIMPSPTGPKINQTMPDPTHTSFPSSALKPYDVQIG
jgi:hypothetical protein